MRIFGYAIAGLLSLFGLIALLISEARGPLGWDLSIARALQDISLPGFGTLMLGVSAFGSYFPFPLLMMLFVSLAFILAKRRREGVFLLASGVGEYVLNGALKITFQRARPSNELVRVLVEGGERGFSFPSGHVMFYVSYFGLLAIFLYRTAPPSWGRALLISFCVALIALVGMSRVYLGVHWPSDTLAGYLSGGAWLMLVLVFYERSRRRALSPAEGRPG